jgi:hypothetical protein
MPVNRHDGSRSEFSEVKGLSAGSTAHIKDCRRRRQISAQAEGFGSARTVARPLPGQGFENLEEYLPETRPHLTHRRFIHHLMRDNA